MEEAYQLIQAGRLKEAEQLVTNFEYCMAKCKLNRSDDLLEDYRRLRHAKEQSDSSFSNEFRIWESFLKSNAHILRRGNNDWPAHKILLQLAIEHADDSPATIEAERFLQEEKCDWAWLRRELRVKHAGISPCEAVFEGHTDNVKGALLLPDRKFLSWSNDGDLRLWDSDGKLLRVLEGHTDEVDGALLLNNGHILSWAKSNYVGLTDYALAYGIPIVIHIRYWMAIQIKLTVHCSYLMEEFYHGLVTTLCAYGMKTAIKLSH